MAIDYIIGVLLILSALVNALALGAFWITPGLQTTANRFVINLLIVNLVGCAALTTSLFYSNVPTLFDASDKYKALNNTLDELTSISKIGTASFEEEIQIIQDDSDNFDYTTVFLQRSNERISELLEKPQIGQNYNLDKSRCWGFDITAALGN